MAMTSERRSTYPLCGAKKKNGETCRAFAGQGTDHLGIGKCKYHGGATHRKAAAKAEAQRKMTTLGVAMNVTPAQALMGLLRATSGHVAWLATEVGALEGLESPEARALINQYADERDRLTRIAKAALDSGIGKAEVEMAEAQTEALAKAINAAMSSVGGLSNDQKKRFGEALRRELAQLSANPDGDQFAPASVGEQLVPTAPEAPPRTDSRAAEPALA
jgi:hypothetical protein